MAYIEENNLMAEPEGPTEIEQGWQEGFHTTREGEEMRLEEMTDIHLKNTIRYFEGKLDVTPLRDELHSRAADIPTYWAVREKIRGHIVTMYSEDDEATYHPLAIYNSRHEAEEAFFDSGYSHEAHEVTLISICNP